MTRTNIIRAIQDYLQSAYVGPITILAEEDDGDLTPPCAVVRIGNGEDMGLNQALIWDFNVIVAAFHDADDTSIETAESQSEALFDELMDIDSVTSFLESKGFLVSVWRPLTTEAGMDQTKWSHMQGFQLIAAPLKMPEVSFSFLETGVVTGGQIRWRGMGIGGDGKLYSIPYYHDEIIVTDPATDTVTEGPSVASWPTDNEFRKWVDCVSLADGRIIANPHLARGHLVIDPASDPASLRAVDSIQGPIGYGMQVRGGAVVGSTLFSTSYDTSPGETSVVRTVNLETEIYGANIGYTNRRDGPFYAANPSASAGGQWGALATDTYWGAVAGGNGKVYGIPFGQERILVVDAATMTAAQGEDTLTGGIEIETWAIPPDAYLAKYTGGTRSGVNGCIYSMPRAAQSVLKIDPSDDSAIEIPLPADYLAFLAEGGYEGDTKSLGSEEGPDGKIYGTLWQVPAILWIDPRTDFIGWIDLRDYLTDTGTTRNHYAYARRVGNAIYYSPASATAVMKMTIS